jgi:integrase/recombinase XerD
VIASCPTDGNGPRDRAVLLLLAKLGLRAGEVARLRFADIDWIQGQITVSGKARRQEKLPLPQEVGDALLCYLRQSRPPLRTPEILGPVDKLALAPVEPERLGRNTDVVTWMTR